MEEEAVKLRSNCSSQSKVGRRPCSGWCDCVFLSVGSEGSSVMGPVVGGVIVAAAVVLIAIVLLVIFMR